MRELSGGRTRCTWAGGSLTAGLSARKMTFRFVFPEHRCRWPISSSCMRETGWSCASQLCVSLAFFRIMGPNMFSSFWPQQLISSRLCPPHPSSRPSENAHCFCLWLKCGSSRLKLCGFLEWSVYTEAYSNSLLSYYYSYYCCFSISKLSSLMITSSLLICGCLCGARLQLVPVSVIYFGVAQLQFMDAGSGSFSMFLPLKGLLAVF